VDIHRQLSILRRWLPLLVVSVIAVGAAAFGLSNLQPRVYQATATLIVGESLSGVNPDYNQLLASQRLSATYAAIATTHEIMDGVVRELGLRDSPEAVAGRVLVSPSPDTSLLTITARDADPANAAAIANAVAKGLIDVSPAVRGAGTGMLESVEEDLTAIRAEIATTQGQVADLLAEQNRTADQETTLQALQSRLISLRSTYATFLAFTASEGANLLTVVQPALSPGGAIAPRPLLDAALAATIALLLVVALVFVIEYLDDAVRDPDEVTATFGLPTLGIVSKMPGGRDRRPFYRLTPLLYPRSPSAESYRTLRANLEFASVDKPLRSILVTSAVPGEGKTVTAANLALVIAQAGRRVLLVDADLRKPGIHEIFSLPNGTGLTSLIRSPSVLPSAVIQTTEQPNLDILTTGPVPLNPTEVIASQRTRDLVQSLVDTYHLVIFDSPPVGMFSDAPVLSSYLDGTLVVVEARRGRRQKIRHALDGLERAGATILGVVLNRTKGQGHGEYSDYYQTADDAGAKEPVHSGADSTMTPAVARSGSMERLGGPLPSTTEGPSSGPASR
jgi:non-specific protein-tyrosine kinase